MAIGTAIFYVFTRELLFLFDATEQMLEIGVPALRIVSICFVFAGYGISCSAMFQALGNGIYSLIVSATRQLLFLVPAAYLLSLTGNLTLVWFAFVIAEAASMVVTTLFLRRIFKKKLVF